MRGQTRRYLMANRIGFTNTPASPATTDSENLKRADKQTNTWDHIDPPFIPPSEGIAKSRSRAKQSFCLLMAAASYHNPGAPSSAKPSMVSNMLPGQGSERGYYEVPNPAAPGTPGSPEMDEKVVKQDRKLKRYIRVMRVVSRFFAFGLSLALTATMALTLHKYYSTRGTIIGGRNAWAANTKLWPTTMLLVIAVVSLTINLTILGSYWHSVKAANRAAIVSTVFTVTVLVTHLVIWIVTVALYRYGKDTNGKSNDLWGWSCGAPGKIQQQFSDVVDFKQYCNLQSGSWYMSMLEAAVEILTVLTYLLVYRRLKVKKAIRKSQAPIPVQNL
ncbi:MAG: hypothetical protein M1832_006111 [Thelocarpon impressellum]|nr:MAG: hypothetical protein M1832_006111 [Thelocarpon impressellum]